MGYKTAVQILKQADELKAKVLKKSDLLIDTQAWTDQQRLQTIYQQTLVLDLEYALDKKVEQDLWNIGFKTYISTLQELIRDKKNTRRSEYQTLLTWCLEAASGFYISLLQELCNVFDIDLPFRRRGIYYGQPRSNGDKTLPQSSSCLYICQYCLIHLGDIARYRNQRKQAESFYRQAIQVSPISGHPYNQLALLEASQGDRLSTVFYYIRGIALKNLFPPATTNLLSTLNALIDKESPLEKVQTKITVSEFIHIFLCTHAFLHTGTDLIQAKLGVDSLNATMTALVATQSFTTDRLLKITAVNLYALKYVSDGRDLNELTDDEKKIREMVMDLLAGSLSAFLVPVHTLKNDESLLEYYALPAVKLLMYWIQNESEVLNEFVFANRLQIWPSLCKLLNYIQVYLKDFDGLKYKNVPLSEDKFLQGFQPLRKSFELLDFKNDEVFDDKTENLIRAQRIVQFGLYLTNLNVNNTKLILKNEEKDDMEFIPGCMQPDPTNDLLEEMKSFNINEASNKKLNEKRGGILKPQGSLEKSREEREVMFSENGIKMNSDLNLPNSLNTISKIEVARLKRPKQNVALQSIFKKIEENKQVKFNVDDDEKKDKSIYDKKSVQKPLLIAPSTSLPQFNLPLRTQSFNQNHPSFPPPPQPPPNPQQDYLNSLRNLSKNQLDSQPTNYVFPPQTDIPPPPLAQYPNQLFTNSTNSKPTSQPYNSPVSFNPHVLPPPPPPSSFQYSYNSTNKMDELSKWWSNSPSSQQQNSFPMSDNFHMNYPYGGGSSNGGSGGGGNLSPFVQQNEFGKGQLNQTSNDLFNSTWGKYSRNSFDGINFENNANGVSIRQAMLNEANNTPNRNFSAQNKFMSNPPSSPGYTLFNTNNTWTPNLVGQLRNPKSVQENPLAHLGQQTLFSGQGPQSLAQLLEQQQSHHKTDS